MKKRNTLIIFIIAIILPIFYTLLKDNNTQRKAYQSKIFFIYSHPFENKSYLTRTTDGKSFKKLTMDVGDLNQIAEGNSIKDIEFLPTYKPKIYNIEKNGTVKVQNVISPLTFKRKKSDLIIEAFNKDARVNILSIQDNKFGYNYQIEFPTYLPFADNDEKYIYVYNDFIEENKNVLYIIDRKKREVIKEVRLMSKVKDIVVEKSQIYLSTSNGLTVLEKESWKSKIIKYPIENVEGNKLYFYNSKIYIIVTDNLGRVNILELNNALKWSRKKSLEINQLSIYFHNDKLYILTRQETDKIGGVVTVISLETLKQLRQFAIPKEDLKVVNFFITMN